MCRWILGDVMFLVIDLKIYIYTYNHSRFVNVTACAGGVGGGEVLNYLKTV